MPRNVAVTKDGIKKPEGISDLQYLLLWRKYLLWHFAVERRNVVTQGVEVYVRNLTTGLFVN